MNRGAPLVEVLPSLAPSGESSLRSFRFSEGSYSLLPLYQCHSIYPSAQHLSQNVVTGGLFIFPSKSWDPFWQTLRHLPMRPLGREQHLVCHRRQTRVCPRMTASVWCRELVLFLFLFPGYRFIGNLLFSECWDRSIVLLTQKYMRQCGFQPQKFHHKDSIFKLKTCS